MPKQIKRTASRPAAKPTVAPCAPAPVDASVDKAAKRAVARATGDTRRAYESRKIAQYSKPTERLRTYLRFYAQHADDTGAVNLSAIPDRCDAYAGSNKSRDRAILAAVENFGCGKLDPDNARITFTPDQLAAARVGKLPSELAAEADKA